MPRAAILLLSLARGRMTTTAVIAASITTTITATAPANETLAREDVVREFDLPADTEGDVAVFAEPDRPVLTAWHRAIYQLRPA